MPDGDSGVRISLAEAVERYRSSGGGSNSYEWYRKQARSEGRVHFGGTYVAAVKEGREWTVAEFHVEQAIAAFHVRQEERRSATVDYERRVIHGADGETIETDWGSYTVSGDFHSTWNSYAAVTRGGGISWYCNTCFKPVQSEHNRPECHTCSDWGGCGRDCTLSRIFCTDCGTSKAM